MAGISVLYFMFLVFMLFQTLDMSKEMIYWLYPDLRNVTLPEKV